MYGVALHLKDRNVGIRLNGLIAKQLPDQGSPRNVLNIYCHWHLSAAWDCTTHHRMLFNFCSLLKKNVLQKDVTCLELPAHTLQAIADCVELDDFDRYIIYTDGSSHGNRRAVPECTNDINPAVDTWSIVVIGEKYQIDSRSQTTLVGWTAQPVLYTEDKTHYVGASRIGSDVAEREAMIWALFWRLGTNDRKPTIIRPDSLTTGKQANGEYGANNSDESFRILRGLYQAVEAILPGDALRIVHTRGHVQEPWNDFVDAAAKQEAKQSMFLPRQPIDLRTWMEDIPHLWTYLDGQGDLPVLCTEGLDAAAPDIPATPIHGEDFSEPPPEVIPVQHCLSAATGNVNSMYSSPDGYGGKVAYLRSQMQQHGLNLLGLQEARTPAGMSQVDGILRLSSGAEGSQYGVELWINLNQPIGHVKNKPQFLNAKHVTVVHAAPQLLFTHIVHDLLTCWIAVAHAPHSGRSVTARETWWEQFDDCIFQTCDQDPLFCLIDANATSGESDGITVFEQDDSSSPNTAFFRHFLSKHAQCLPATVPSLHEGDQITWMSPDGQYGKRIDHVTIPQQYLQWCQHSEVLNDFDLGLAHDHAAVAIDMQWTSQQEILPPRPSDQVHHMPEYDRSSIARIDDTQWNAHHFLPWSTDIGAQVKSFNQQMHVQLRKSSVHKTQHGKKPFMTTELWQLRSQKLKAKRNVSQIHRSHNVGLLRACFCSWRVQQAREVDDLAAHRIRTDCLLIHWYCRLQMTAHILRERLKATKFEHVAQCMQDLHCSRDPDHDQALHGAHQPEQT